MTTLIDDPPRLGTEEPPSPPRRRRWWVLAVAIAIAAPVVFFGVRKAQLSSFQPLSSGSLRLPIEVTGPREDLVRKSPTYDTHPPYEAVVIPFQKGGTLQLGFDLSNRSERPVRVTDISNGPDASQYVTVLDPTDVRVSNGEHCCAQDTDKIPLFRPFELEANERVVVVLNYAFACQRFMEPGSSLIDDNFDVRFEAFGGEKEVVLPLPWRLVLEAPRKGDCSPSESAYGPTA
jgi:hypothetical protein